MLRQKINDFANLAHWCYFTPPNTWASGSLSVLRLLYWTAVLKRVRETFVGSYLGMQFLYDTQSDGCSTVYTNPYPEYGLARFMSFWLRPGAVVVDIGSNVGYFTLLAAQHEASVYSFEPNTEVRRIQQVNVLLNGYETLVTLSGEAVSDTNEESTFLLQDKRHSLESSLVFDRLHQATPTRIQCTTLDTVIGRQQLKTIHLLKVDVEGAEEAVFAGGKDALARGIIQAIFWETNDSATLKERKQLLAWLSKQGYQHVGISGTGRALNILPWSSGQANCLSIHTSQLERFRAFGDEVSELLAQS